MKKFSKILSVALLVALVLSLGVANAFADEPTTPAVPTAQVFDDSNAADANGQYTISVASDDAHTYTVYQILTGTLVPGTSKLGNPAWGSDAIGTGSVDDFIEEVSAEGLTNKQINALVEAQLKKDADGKISADGVGTVDKSKSLNVVPGYYLIVDTTETLAEGDTYSLNIVAVFNDITITPKKSTTTTDKSVKDINDSTDSAMTEWADSADHDIGDKIPFQLKATIAADYDNYSTYYFAFHDEEGTGLTFDPTSVKVYVDGTAITSGYEVKTSGFAEGDNCTFEVVFANLKDIGAVKAGSVITVEYVSELNSSAVVGNPGNPNKMYGEFSNNPNEEHHGKTPTDTVVVFTFKTDVDKIDGENKPLAGAGFTLYKKYKAAVEGKTNVAGTTPAGAKEGTFPSGEYWYAVGTATASEGQNFEFAGIDDGTYVLVESTTPAGYNTMDPITFTVEATHGTGTSDTGYVIKTLSAGSKFTASAAGGEIAMKKDKTEHKMDSGEIYGEIVNNSGTQLPSTGGIGTTIFYVVGGVLVLAAIILLVTKKRMSE